MRKSPSSTDATEPQFAVRRQSPGPAEGALPGGDEILPRRSVEIDIDLLAKTGLFPARKDAELIAEQFRRIKRPVVQLAFDPKKMIGPRD